MKIPMLINRKNPMPPDYYPELMEISDDYFLEKNACKAMNALLKAAAKCGVKICIFSAYRSSTYQQKLFDDEVKIYTEQGYSYSDALEKASQAVALPYTSEHNAGLAADVSSPELFGQTTTAFDKTRQFEWLDKNACKYKEHITGIMYEPWHYRYVGTPHACIIKENSLTLEEYIKKFPV